MKYLKKFEAKIKTVQSKDLTNWSGNPKKVIKPLDPEYFNMVFIEFIDEGSEVDFNIDEEDSSKDYWEIFISEPKVGGYLTIEQHIKSIDKLKEKYLDIEVAIGRVEDEYPNINVVFIIEESGENNAWVNTIKRDIHLIFNYK